jgi:hypothetical protein
MLKYPFEDPCPTVLGSDDHLRPLHCLKPWGHDGVHWDGSHHHTIGSRPFADTMESTRQKSRGKR